MYSLRKISKAQAQVNFLLGNYYTFVSKEEHPEVFQTVYQAVFGDENPRWENVYAFITTSDEHYALSKGEECYIVQDNGKTYSNVTFRN